MKHDGLVENTVHHSLLKTPRFLGVDWRFLVIEGALMGGIVFVVGFTAGGLLLAGLGALLIHVPVRRLLAHDPLMVKLVWCAVKYEAYYAPVSRTTVAPPLPRQSISLQG
jgi:type IV secretory pathway TrbD component